VEYHEVARASSDRGEVVLRRRSDPEATAPDVLELRVNGVFVMDSLETTAETALASAALAHVASPTTVLVGGLGLGFTAREVLSDSRVEQVVVAEIEDALVGWFRDGTVPHGPAFLADQRVRVAVADVRQVVDETPPESLDLVLLDVDNGPDFLVFDANATIYESPFLERVRVALRPGGAVAIWSSTESPRLVDTMTSAFGGCASEAHRVTLQGREDMYWLHIASRV
jgi:spermidine synthase